MEELRIKCPSCGIILDVRNSKNEAVKRITCPNCKKQLAVTFHEEPKPAQFVEIKMVQLADGSQKTIVRALTDEHVVKVNGEQLQKDDEVVLAPGDKLEIDDTNGTFTKEGFVVYQQTNHPSSTKSAAPEPQNTKVSTPLPPISSPKIHSRWPIYAAFLIGTVLVFAIWKLSNQQPEQTTIQPTIAADTIAEAPKEQPKVKDTQVSESQPNPKEKKSPEEYQPVKTNISSLSNYELEKLAMKGDVEAQCMLGKRWVSRHDSINVVKGIKYLKLAAQNGSSEARSTLRTVYAALQQSAANGSTSAANILREQR